MTDRHSFIFSIDKLKELVGKHTAFLGKMRVTDKDPDAADRISFTSGEDFLFDDYLNEAAAETYGWIKAFGRGVPNAFRVFLDGELHVIKENFGARILHDGASSGLNYSTVEFTPSISDESVRPTFIRWRISVSNLGLTISLGDATSLTYKVRIHYTEALQRTPFSSQHVAEVENTVTEDTTITSVRANVVTELVPEFEDIPVVTSIDRVELEITNITPVDVSYSKGEYVKYVNDAGMETFGRLAADYHSATQMTGSIILTDVSGTDIRNSVIMTVELPDWQDRNMLPAVNNYLQEALVNYIISRWVENVNPKEVERYLSRFEEKAHQAQLGLNSEARILQRHGHRL